ncbi:MAG: type VI secretion system tip protein TssI/VgrG [Gemmatimonadales bacterium]
MAKFSQANRPMRVDTVLPVDDLLLEGFSGSEAVSSPFAYTLDLLSEKASVPAAKVLRTPVCLTIKGSKFERSIHGIVRSFTQLGQSEDLTSYRAEVVPWFWFLSLSSDCKIFQHLSVPEIVEQVFSGLGYSDYQMKLVKTYPKRLFCVQYRESHLSFVSRLLEEEGIFYFFEHSSKKHVLTLADDNSAFKTCPGQSASRMATTAASWQEEDVVLTCEREDAVHTGKVTLRDYDYDQPMLSLESAVTGKEPEEAYGYPGGYTTLEEGERYARLQLEAEEAQRQVIRATSTCRAFQSGYRFDLKEHYSKETNQPYVLLELRHTARAGDYRSWESTPMDYHNDFLAIPASVPYHPFRQTHKPRIWGSQPALVVGKKGEEIWTDKHGRVKVQFYWDRLGKKDENSSCWIRVSQPWAGKGWGSLAIPRIGQEVIVEFMEGDPDQPIITGKVYNADQTPPYDPSKGGVVSGLRSNTHKGKGYNEMSMDDTAGKEKVTIHAQYDMSTTVENNDTQHIVTGNRKIDIDTGTHTEKIKGATSITIVTGPYKLDVQTGTHTHHVKANVIENYDADQTTTVAHKIKIDGGDEIMLVSGASSITLKKDGKISIHCKNLSVIGDADIKASAPKVEISGGDEAKVGVDSQNVVFNKQKVATSGAAINSSAVGMHEITGALVKIN